MFKILSTLRKDELKQLIHEAREHRSIINNENQDELIEMDPLIRDEIFSILPQKSKFYLKFYVYIASSGTAFRLLKKGAKLHRTRAVPKKHPSNLNLLKKNEEEDKNNDEDQN